MLPSSRAARLLPHLARSAVTAAAPKKIWQKSTVARASPTPAATPAKRTITRNATPSRAALIVEDAGMDAPLPEIPATSALAASPDISPPNAAVMQQQPILDSSAPSPAVPASPPPVASSSTIAAIKSFPSTSGFPSQSIPTPAAPTATPVHQPVPFSVPVEQRQVDWVTSFHGMSAQPFSDRAADALMRPLLPTEIEIKPDGIVYLPEIQYRRILNKAFGPGGWGLVPRGEMTIMKGLVSREWGLVAGGRLVSVARGEQTFFDPLGVPTATEGCKSNALMRCCKDLGIASELWEPSFVRSFKTAHCVEAWVEHATTKKKQRRWRKKGNKFEYPLIETKS